jgi:sugar lactone lactonase YvrE
MQQHRTRKIVPLVMVVIGALVSVSLLGGLAIAGSSAATISDTVAETSVDTTPDAAAVATVSADDGRGPVVTPLAEFGSDDFVTGSTIGPDGALYVTDGVAGAVVRIDGSTGDVSPYADGLPPKAFPDADIGGPVDVAFAGDTAYVLVTLVSGDLNGEPFGDPEAKNGLYRIEPDGSNTLVADLGQWSVDHPPEPAIVVDTGVQFALETDTNGFLVTDGHHNRVLRVSENGSIDEVATFENAVPTGLETVADDIFVTQLGPIPHIPEDGKVLALGPNSEAREVASGASMLIDVERGPHDQLYAVSMGQWDGVGEGSRADPDTGRLLVVGPDGDLTPVVDGDGDELVLDRPTSVEFVESTGYVVSVTGVVYRVDGL